MRSELALAKLSYLWDSNFSRRGSKFLYRYFSYKTATSITRAIREYTFLSQYFFHFHNKYNSIIYTKLLNDCYIYTRTRRWILPCKLPDDFLLINFINMDNINDKTFLKYYEHFYSSMYKYMSFLITIPVWRWWLLVILPIHV